MGNAKEELQECNYEMFDFEHSEKGDMPKYLPALRGDKTKMMRPKESKLCPIQQRPSTSPARALPT